MHPCVRQTGTVTMKRHISKLLVRLQRGSIARAHGGLHHRSAYAIVSIAQNRHPIILEATRIRRAFATTGAAPSTAEEETATKSSPPPRETSMFEDPKVEILEAALKQVPEHG